MSNPIFVIRSVAVISVEVALVVKAILTLELWWVSLALSGTSFFVALEVDARFSDRSNKLTQKRLAEARKNIRGLLGKAAKASPRELDNVAQSIFDMAGYREKAEEPKRLSDSLVDAYFFASFFFLISVLIRAGLDLAVVSVQSVGPLESYLFSLGLLLFAGSYLYTRKLMRMIRDATTE